MLGRLCQPSQRGYKGRHGLLYGSTPSREQEPIHVMFRAGSEQLTTELPVYFVL